MFSRRKRLHLGSSKPTTFAEVLSEPPLDAEGGPYICRFQDPEDSDLGSSLTCTQDCCWPRPCSGLLILLASWRAAWRDIVGIMASPMCSSAEWEELPEIPHLYLADMVAFDGNAIMGIYGTEMDVSKTGVGVKRLKRWRTDPAEIALYERGWPLLPILLVRLLASSVKACICVWLHSRMPSHAVWT